MKFGCALVGIAALVWHADAHACSCGDPNPPATELRYASVVFVGTIRAIERHEMTNGVQVRVNRAFKGTSAGASIFFTTAAGGGYCGLQVTEGSTWLLYLERAGDHFQSMNCGRSKPVGYATDEIAQLAALIKPKVDASAPDASVADASVPADASAPDASTTLDASPPPPVGTAPDAGAAPAPTPSSKGCAFAAEPGSTSTPGLAMAALAASILGRRLARRQKRNQRRDDR